VLFSEPKIPQWSIARCAYSFSTCFSALQRAENSSMLLLYHTPRRLSSVSVLFSEPKIPQSSARPGRAGSRTRFSALQRAENSSILRRALDVDVVYGFSALQRAENSSIERR